MPKWVTWVALYVLLPAELAFCIYVVGAVLWAFTLGGGVGD